MQCCENVLLLTYSTKLRIFIAYLEYHFGILLYNNIDLCPERDLFPRELENTNRQLHNLIMVNWLKHVIKHHVSKTKRKL